MKIAFDNREEQKQILDILLGLGYKWHGQTDLITSDQIMEEWGNSGYTSISVDYSNRKKGAIQMSYRVGDVYSWTDDMNTILANLKNYKIVSKKIRINNVGEYHAIVTPEDVEIFKTKLSHETVQVVYDTFDKIDEGGLSDTLHITTKDDQENKDLITLLYSLGWSAAYRNTLEDTIEFFREFRSKVVYTTKNIGGNYDYYGGGDREYTMEDLGEIYTKLKGSKNSVIALPPIGEYNVLVYKDHVQVGCQSITKEKVKEILEAIDKIKQ